MVRSCVRVLCDWFVNFLSVSWKTREMRTYRDGGHPTSNTVVWTSQVRTQTSHPIHLIHWAVRNPHPMAWVLSTVLDS